MEDRPGGAANVALNAAALGGRVWLAGIAGQGEAGDVLATRLAERGVTCPLDPRADVPTITKLRVLSHHQQLLRLDFEKPPTARSSRPWSAPATTTRPWWRRGAPCVRSSGSTRCWSPWASAACCCCRPAARPLHLPTRARELGQASRGSERHTVLDRAGLLAAVAAAKAQGERIVMTNGCFDRPEEVAGAECVRRAGGEVRILPFLAGRSTTRILEALRRV